MIKGGYILQARKIQESDIAQAPPHVRETWNLILLRCSHAPRPDYKLQRGQLLISTKEIREALHWRVGYRKETYSLSQCENSMKWLRKAGMITTTKTVRGTIITVCNYDHYQDKKNYECRDESRDDCPNDAGVMPDDRQELKELKELKKIFNEARKLFPGAKNGLDTEFEYFKKKHKDWEVVLPQLIPAIKKQIQWRDNVPEGTFLPPWKHFKTWINNRCWEEEFPIHSSGNGERVLPSPELIQTEK